MKITPKIIHIAIKKIIKSTEIAQMKKQKESEILKAKNKNNLLSKSRKTILVKIALNYLLRLS
jgi:hypothetical protein